LSALPLADRIAILNERLELPEALLSRSDLRDLGHPRRAIDTIFRKAPTIHWEGYSRPMNRVADYFAYREECTYRGDRVRP
jgi:hypothetical protein